jgi:acyl-CoA dehydrogenase
MAFPLSPKAADLKARVARFMEEHVYPAEPVFERQLSEAPTRWQIPPVMEELKAKAQAQGLWNLFLPESELGAGLTNMEYGQLCEVMGRSPIGSEPFNCSAPDTGNMEVLVRYGTREHQERWLKPLLAGEIRSCFAMTEPGIASSDATNIRPRSAARATTTSSTAASGGRPAHGSALQDRDLDGARPTRPAERPPAAVDGPGPDGHARHHGGCGPLTVFGYDDAPHGHAEVQFENVRVPASNILLGEGRGFEIAQGPPGSGPHPPCMRQIGVADRALETPVPAGALAQPLGKTIASRASPGTGCGNRAWTSTRRASHAPGRAAHGRGRQQGGRREIAMIKVVAPNVACGSSTARSRSAAPPVSARDFHLAAAYAMRARCASSTVPTRSTGNRSPRSSSPST